MADKLIKIRSYVRAFCRTGNHEMCSGINLITPTRVVVCSDSCHRADDQPDTSAEQILAHVAEYQDYLRTMVQHASDAATAAFDRASDALEKGRDDRAKVYDIVGIRHQARATVCAELLVQFNWLMHDHVQPWRKP